MSVFKATPGIRVLSSDRNGGGSSEGGFAKMTDVLTLFPHIDAVFAINDPTAIGVEEAALEGGEGLACVGSTQQDEAFDVGDVVRIGTEVTKGGDRKPGAVGFVGTGWSKRVIDRIVEPAGHAGEKGLARIEIARVLERLHGPEDLDEVGRAVVGPMGLRPAPQQVGAGRLDGVVEGVGGKVGEVLPPPADQRGHGGQSPRPLSCSGAGSGWECTMCRAETARVSTT